MNRYYNKNIIEDIDLALVLSPFFDEWLNEVKDILLSDEFQRRKLFPHHHNMTVWDHSILVSFNSYVYSKYFNADSRVCALAGLLHDFYPEAWLYSEELEKLDSGKYTKGLKVRKSFFKQHGFIHGPEAAKNYVKFFPNLENKKITDSIKCHMFPLTIKPPRYKEGWIITLVDKLNSVHELPSVKVVPSIIKKQASTAITKVSRKIRKQNV